MSDLNSVKHRRIPGLLPVLIFLGLLLVFLYVIFTESSNKIYFTAFLWIVTVVALLWVGNRYIFLKLAGKKSFNLTTPKFLFQLFLSTLYSLVCINITYYFYRFTAISVAPGMAQILVLNVYGLLFIIPVLSINFGVFFMMQWKKAHLLSDKLKEENLRSQLETLKMHLDPHFLFNNLNVLSSLIENKPKDARDFLDRFVDVYRYVLQYKKEELVAIKTELEFLNSYIYLLNQRFNGQLRIIMEIPDGSGAKRYIPPMSLQMLLENAIKHNKIVAENPLEVRITMEDEVISVANNYQPRQGVQELQLGSGLENIKKRYGYLTDLPVEIIQTDVIFKVKLPLLEMEDEEIA